jgi:hypothetical protein
MTYSEIIVHDLIPTNQYGGRMASSTLETGLTLTHDIQVAHAAGLRTGLSQGTLIILTEVAWFKWSQT